MPCEFSKDRALPSVSGEIAISFDTSVVCALPIIFAVLTEVNITSAHCLSLIEARFRERAEVVLMPCEISKDRALRSIPGKIATLREP